SFTSSVFSATASFTASVFSTAASFTASVFSAAAFAVSAAAASVFAVTFANVRFLAIINPPNESCHLLSFFSALLRQLSIIIAQIFQNARKEHFIHESRIYILLLSDKSPLPCTPVPQSFRDVPHPGSTVSDRMSTRLNSSHVSISY